MKLVRPAIGDRVPYFNVAVLKSALAASGTATAELRHRSSTGAWSLSGTEVAVEALPGFSWGGTDLPVDTPVLLAWIEGVWIVIAATCPEEEA